VEGVNLWDFDLSIKSTIKHNWLLRPSQRARGNLASWQHFHTGDLTFQGSPKFKFTLEGQLNEVRGSQQPQPQHTSGNFILTLLCF
jgi:hypothetical protein